MSRFTENPFNINDNLTARNAAYFRHSLIQSVKPRQQIVQTFYNYVINKQPAPIRSPQTIYAMMPLIGEGGNGKVYQVQDLDLGMTLIAEVLKQGKGIIYGSKTGSIPKLDFEYSPAHSYASLRSMITQSMTLVTSKKVWTAARHAGGLQAPVLAVKVQLLTNNTDVEDIRHENVVHAELSNNPKLSKLIPEMYAAATIIVPSHPTKTPVALRVTFMKLVSPTFKPLSVFIKDASGNVKAKEKLYCKLRDAFIELWASGYAHGDAHTSNILIDNNNKKVCFIDFGFAVRLSPATHQLCIAMREAKYRAEPKPQLELKFIACFNAVEDELKTSLSRRYSWADWINLDTSFLKMMRLYINDNTRGFVSHWLISTPRKLKRAGVSDEARAASMYRNAANISSWFLATERIIQKKL